MESKFQFTNPSLMGLEFSINEEFNIQENREVQIRMDMSVQVSRRKDANEAVVSLTFEIGEKNENSPFCIKATEKADFRWEDGLEDSMVDGLLNQNAPSLLLAYLRPIIVQVTAASPYDAYNIPFINFSGRH